MVSCNIVLSRQCHDFDGTTALLALINTQQALCVYLQVISAGWTLSPLQPEYLEGRPSHQCLVTLVLKLDLGGWLSSSSGSFVGSLLQPFMTTLLGSSVRNAFLQPLMMSVISLRDKASLSLHRKSLHCTAAS